MFLVRLSSLAVAGLFFLWTHDSSAVTIEEGFATDPALRGWRAIGQTSLFSWNSTNQNLEVTWDSAQSNSFYCLPLGTVLAISDEFSFAFDLRLTDLTVGPNPAKPYSFELAIGLVNLAQASATNFFRASGSGTPNLLEFDYFPDDGSGFFSIDTTMADMAGNLQFYYVNLPLDIGETYRVSTTHSAGSKGVQTVITRNGTPYCELTNAFPSGSFSDFRLDHLAVCSYSDAGQDPLFGGSVLAHGTVDQVTMNMPSPPVSAVTGRFAGSTWEVTCSSQTNWLYSLERTLDFETWIPASSPLPGTGTDLVLVDTNAPSPVGLYRVKAARP